jgi:hypothetical protein
MAALYVVLPDGRDDAAWTLEAQRAMRAWNQAHEGHETPFRTVSFRSPILAVTSEGDMDPDDMLALLRQIDWAYPAKLLYRTESEDTWSFVTLGLSLRELGEAG